MPDHAKEIIGAVTVVLGAAGTLLYLWGIFRQGVRPHVFSWVVWGTLMSVGYAAQYSVDTGPGTWNLGFGAASAFLIAGISCFRGEKHITRGDWAAFGGAMLSIPLWVATKNPFWSVLLISAIDAAAFYPTFRKSWARPREEAAFVFFMAGVQFFLSVFALEEMTVVSALYPMVVGTANFALVSMLLYRRKTF